MIDEKAVKMERGFHDVYIYHRADGGASTSAKVTVKSLAYLEKVSYRPEKQRTARPNLLPACSPPIRLGFQS
jgi:hypothetical protein